MAAPLAAGGENAGIAQSVFLHQTKKATLGQEEIKAALDQEAQRNPAVTRDTQKMNMCQSINNAMDLVLERDEKAGTLSLIEM